MSSEQQAVMVDMEEGVVGELLGGPLGEVFDSQQLLTDVSGSGNNWLINTHTTFVYIHSFSHHNSFFTKRISFVRKFRLCYCEHSAEMLRMEHTYIVPRCPIGYFTAILCAKGCGE